MGRSITLIGFLVERLLGAAREFDPRVVKPGEGRRVPLRHRKLPFAAVHRHVDDGLDPADVPLVVDPDADGTAVLGGGALVPFAASSATTPAPAAHGAAAHRFLRRFLFIGGLEDETIRAVDRVQLLLDIHRLKSLDDTLELSVRGVPAGIHRSLPTPASPIGPPAAPATTSPPVLPFFLLLQEKQ